MSKNTFKYSLISSLVAALTATQAVNAAPGQLAQAPLYLSSGVRPNIFFMIDDSGSMDWSDLLNTGTFSPGNVLLTDFTNFIPPTNAFGSTWFRRFARLSCRGFNTLAYDPNVTYTPWEGVDSAGNPYQSQTLAAARENPYSPGDGTRNLTAHRYWAWNDADGDGAYDGPNDSAWTGGDPVSAADECGDVSNINVGVRVSTLTPAQQTNYANWFSYYRKREYVMKRALSAIITSSSARMGLATINAQNDNSLTNNSADINSPVANIDDITLPVDPTAAANKTALLRSLFRINSAHATPLRRGLERVGEYYLGNNPPAGWGASPILPTNQGGECQQNFAILMSDGFWNGEAPAANNADGDNNTIWDGSTYGDGFSNTLADVAMKYYEIDMRPTYGNIVPPVPGLDENTSQHMVTFTVAFGVRGSLAADQIPPSPNPWPQPVMNDVTTVDDMAHAAYNGRGKFLSARDPDALISTLSASIREISVRSGTATAVTTNSANLRTDAMLYQTGFDSHNWSGSIVAKPIVNTGFAASLGATAWNGGTLLDNRTTPRSIFSHDGTSGVNFAWNNLTVAQQADMCAVGRNWSDPNVVQWLSGWPAGCSENNGSIIGNTRKARDLVDYIRGDRGNEGEDPGEFRIRDSRLGDLVYSTPLFVGKPEARYPDSIESVPYSSYVQSQANRPGTVYVGGNDGMLHAFNSPENLTSGGGTPGEEVFAYIPSMVFSANEGEGLHYLAEQQVPNNYQHRYYVDLSPNAADVFINTGSGNAWHTVLVGGLRAGGKGLFALNITDPTNVTASNLPLWEFTHPDLGYTFSEVSIGRMNNGKWAAIFGNGYNNDPTGDGRAKLFIVDIETGNLIKLIDTGVGTVANNSCSDAASDCNGLSTPAVADLNGDGIIDRVYAGDLQGNMWVFDLSKNTTSPTSTAHWAPAYGTSTPMFRACSASPCTSTNRQPITTKPVVARHPHKKGVDTSPNVMVYFGTGQFVAGTDNSTTQTQTFYGVWDTDWSATAANKTVTTPPLTRTKLQQQSITTETTKAVGAGTVELRTITDNPVNYEGTPPAQFGWYIDLPTTKERMVVTPHAVGNLLFFNTLIPTADLCGGGSGWLMSVSQLNGGAPALPAVDLDNNGTFDGVDMLGTENPAGVKMDAIPTESRFSADKRVTANSRGEVKFESIQTLPPSGPSRMSWTVLSE